MKPVYDRPQLELLDGPWVRLLRAITWRGAYPNVVPADFVTDGGTIPALLWPVVGHPLSNRVFVCYVLHDFELQQGYRWSAATQRFNARLAAVGCARLRRWVIVAGVWLRGQWKRLTRKNRPPVRTPGVTR